jgi:hypothetical protein
VSDRDDEPEAPGGPRERLLGFLRAQRPPLLCDEEPGGATLLEPASGQRLRLRWSELEALEEKRSPLREQPWLVLLFTDGRQLALADVGFAFAPSSRNSGPLPELPATFCFADLRTLLSGIDALLTQEGRGAEAMRAFLVAIALVDGARSAGFDVAREERALEQRLQNLERLTSN